ncbi:hypothetical protein BR1R3_50310 [Pseudomonas atacamensis]|nr:hypothetical protein BR1R3_50310 [Pseudomonas atacamensis]
MSADVLDAQIGSWAIEALRSFLNIERFRAGGTLVQPREIIDAECRVVGGQWFSDDRVQRISMHQPGLRPHKLF